MYKKYFSKFLEANKEKLHFACHSHHFWPDCTLEAQIKYWKDASKFLDDKWGYFFSKEIPELQKKLARFLNLKEFEQITFAQNTHELIYRLLSSFFHNDKKVKIWANDNSLKHTVDFPDLVVIFYKKL